LRFGITGNKKDNKQKEKNTVHRCDFTL